MIDPVDPLPDPETYARSNSTSQGDRYRILLTMSQAASSELELNGMLAQLLTAVAPFVPLDGIGVTALRDGMLVPQAIHMAGVTPGPREPFHKVLAHAVGHPIAEKDTAFPLTDSPYAELAKTGDVLVVQDLEREARYQIDHRLFAFGIRSAVRAPLVLRGRLIGSIAYIRLKTRAFTPDQVSILKELTPLVATAVANALAYEEVARLKNRLEQENLVLREEVDGSGMYEEIVGSSKALREVITQIEKVARTDSTVLITGETGVGKELIARAVHRRSTRSGQAMVKVSCAALPATLIASELFGHERGAFTGASQRRVGRFELAASGSIFLDEVGELPPEIQVSLLRVIQEREFERVGGSQTIRTDARVIAATNRDLKAEAAEGRFRNDLYYRLNVFPIDVPPLRKRREDIPVLVEYFAARHGARIGKRFQGIDKRTMDRLVSYDWPGNVRECSNVIERATIISEGLQLQVEENLLARAEGSPAQAPEDLQTGKRPSAPVLQKHERELIERALAQSGGRVSGEDGAARRLGIPSSTLESKIKKFGIDKFRHRSASHD